MDQKYGEMKILGEVRSRWASARTNQQALTT
jgi:hypothetical protein